MNIKNVLKLTGSILLCEAAGVAGEFAALTQESFIWYDRLFKPVLAPPLWVLYSGWGIMYLLMGIALALVLTGNSQTGKKSALVVFGTSFVLSALLIPVFLGLESTLAGFIISVLLWLSLFLSFYKFYKVTIPASVFICPLIIWSAYITGLTLAFWLLNDTHWMAP